MWEKQCKMDFPEDFNQLELLNTHGHLIPRGASSLWTGSKDEDEEADEEEGEHSEEWYLEKEENLKDKPADLFLWAAENNRVSDKLSSIYQTHAVPIDKLTTQHKVDTKITMFFTVLVLSFSFIPSSF